jgi:methyl-accepting chemotaxis protein
MMSSLKSKLTLMLLAACIVVIAALTTFVIAKFSAISEQTQNEWVKAKAESNAAILKAFLDAKFGQIKDFVAMLETGKDDPDHHKLASIEIYLRSIANQGGVKDVYAVFERGAYIHKDSTKEGFYVNVEAFNVTGTPELLIDLNSSIKDDDDWYHIPKQTKNSHLIEPYKYAYDGDPTRTEYSMITLAAPLIFDGKFIGAVGIDVAMEDLGKEVLNDMTDKATDSHVFLVSNKGLIAWHPDSTQWLKPFEKPESAIKMSEDGNPFLIAYKTVLAQGTSLPWTLAFEASMDILQAPAKSVVRSVILYTFFAIVILGIGFYLLFSHILAPFSRTTLLLRDIAEGEGDLTARLHVASQDEIGKQAVSFNELMKKLQNSIHEVKLRAVSFEDQAHKLSDISKNMTDIATATKDQTAVVAESTNDVAQNINVITGEAQNSNNHAREVAGVAEQMSTSMHTMTETIEKMSASISEIARNSLDVQKISNEASEKAKNATSVMAKLGIAAKEIGQVTDVIKKIADKTNLLALNATIEAASAGEAGKGFAVVAGEIKELANQSAKSADDIAYRIESIQNETGNAVTAINSVSDTIQEIRRSIEETVEHVNEQTKASDEISSNVSKVSSNARDVTSAINSVASEINGVAKNAEEATNSSHVMSKSINMISEDTAKVVSTADEVQNVSASLAKSAEELIKLMGSFKT